MRISQGFESLTTNTEVAEFEDCGYAHMRPVMGFTNRGFQDMMEPYVASNTDFRRPVTIEGAWQ